jgi:hypothetical protein
MLTACFDGAGKPDKPVVLVAGFASFAAVWQEFDTGWSSVLEDFVIPIFMLEISHTPTSRSNDSGTMSQSAAV